MRQLGALLRAKVRIGRHWVASVRRESKLKVAFVSVSAVFLWLLAFVFSFGVFYLFRRFGAESLTGPGAGDDLTDLVMGRLLAVLALALFFLLIVSNVLVAFATVYRSREVAYLLQSPLPIATFFLGRFYECVTFSSWALAFLGSPVLIAYGLIRDASPFFYLAMAVFYLPFVVIPAALGSSVTIVLVRVFAGMRRAVLVAVALLVVIGLFFFFRTRVSSPDVSQAETFQAIVEAMGATQSPFLPSHWLSEGLLAAAGARYAEALFYLLVLTANALFFVWIAVLAAERWFYHGWTELVGSDEGRAPAGSSGPLRLLDPLLRPLPQPWRALVAKDLKLFWRDPAQWSQFLIFFGIMALYLANIRSTAGVFARDSWREWIALLNMSAAMLILATLTTRFIFPLISLEGRRFWILGLSPLPLGRIMWQKFWLSVATTSVFTVGLAVLSGLRLELSPLHFTLTLASIVATTAALSGLAVGLGSLYPNFEEDNPARITSGMGGTLNFILSLGYIVLVTVAQAVIFKWDDWNEAFGGGERTRATAVVLGAVALLTLLTCLVPMRLGRRSLERAEL